MPAKTSIYSVDIYVALLKGMDNERIAQQILDNHESGNLSLFQEENDRANNEEDSTLPETEETNLLTELILNRVIEVVEEHYPKKKYNIEFDRVIEGKNMIWSHVTMPNESTIYHNHYLEDDTKFTDLSCVYYVKTSPKCGNIRFNPITHDRKMFTVEPEDGMLIIFPSWLPHFTERNLSKNVRVCISANFIIRESCD